MPLDRRNPKYQPPSFGVISHPTHLSSVEMKEADVVVGIAFRLCYEVALELRLDLLNSNFMLPAQHLSMPFHGATLAGECVCLLVGPTECRDHPGPAARVYLGGPQDIEAQHPTRLRVQGRDLVPRGVVEPGTNLPIRPALRHGMAVGKAGRHSPGFLFQEMESGAPRGHGVWGNAELRRSDCLCVGGRSRDDCDRDRNRAHTSAQK